MHLKSLHIQNFQSHKSTVLELEPGVNAIVGPTNSGKSAVIRALKWLVYNVPNGEAFRSNWGGDTEVHAEFADGHVSRVRDKTFNGYILNMEDKFKGFGRGVPEPVIQFLNMEEINFQGQLDPPFLLSKSPGERGAFINKLANLDIIDKTVQKNKTMIASDKREIGRLDADIKDLEGQMQEFAGLNDLSKRLARLEKLEEEITQIEDQEEDLVRLLEKAEHAEEYISQFEATLQAEKAVKEADAIVTAIVALDVEIQALDELLDDIDMIQNNIEDEKQAMEKATEEFESKFPEVCPLCGKNPKVCSVCGEKK